MTQITPRGDGVINVTLAVDGLSFKSGEFDSGRYRIGTFEGGLASGAQQGDGIYINDPEEMESGRVVSLLYVGSTYVRAGGVLSGGDYIQADGQGRAVKSDGSSGDVVVGKVLGPSTQVYAANDLAAVYVNVIERR